MPRKHGDHDALERMVFFSDAVFAIAITLLIIEIHVPHVVGTARQAWHALLEQWPSFFGFVLSFMVIGRFWIGHHRALGWTTHYSPRLLWPNLLLLMMIAFMPFATAFMSSNLGQLVPTLVYDLTLFVTGVMSMRVVEMATSPGLAAEEMPTEERAVMLARGSAIICAVLLSAAVAFLSPEYSFLMLLAIIPLQRLLLVLFRRRTGDAAPSAPGDQASTSASTG